MKMKAGDMVEIYQRPFSREDYEGAAVLVSKLSEDRGNQSERWVVRFEDGEYERTIYTGESVPQ